MLNVLLEGTREGAINDRHSAHPAESPAKVKRTGGLVIPPHVAKRNRPLLDLGWFENRFTQGWARQAIGPLMCADPDQVAIPLDEDVFRRSAPPTDVFVDFSIARRNKPGHFFGSRGIGNIKDANAGIEPSHGHDVWLRGARLQPALRVM